MRPRSLFSFLLMFLLLTGCAVQAATNLLPGLTYFDGPEKLTGKLTFLLKHDVRSKTNTGSSASIYEFDLSSKSLRKVVDSPNGLFIPSFHGDLLCVVYRPGDWYRSQDTNAFIYSATSGLSQTLNLESQPDCIAIAGGHVFFQLKGYNFSQPGSNLTNRVTAGGTKILDFDVSKNHTRSVELSDASQWQYQKYDKLHAPRGQSNILHFYYKGFGQRVGNGRDYRSGYYSLDIRTGGVQWQADELDDEDDDAFTFKAQDGRYIFFEGPAGSGSPIHGFKLLSSPWNDFDTREDHAKAPEVKVLKTFSKLATLGLGYYTLHTISPDGRFALVSLEEVVVAKSMLQSGSVRTYYAVDVSNGKVRTLIKDDVGHTTYCSTSEVWWVESGR